MSTVGSKMPKNINNMNDNINFLFLEKIALLNSQLRSLETSLRKLEYFNLVKYSQEISFNDIQNFKNPSIDIYFSCELPNILLNDIHTLEMGISIFQESECWIYESSVNWYGYEIGGIQQKEMTFTFDLLEDLLIKLDETFFECKPHFELIIKEFIDKGAEMPFFKSIS